VNNRRRAVFLQHGSSHIDIKQRLNKTDIFQDGALVSKRSSLQAPPTRGQRTLASCGRPAIRLSGRAVGAKHCDMDNRGATGRSSGSPLTVLRPGVRVTTQQASIYRESA